LGILVAKMSELRNALSSGSTSSGVVSSQSAGPKWACETPVELVGEPFSPLEMPDNTSNRGMGRA